MVPLFATGVIYNGGNLPLVSLKPVATTLAKLVAKFAGGVIDTGGKLAAGVVDTGGSFAAGVIELKIYLRIFKKNRNGPNGIL